ncbi:hypothetical protein [Mucilaginibacter celer]|uniref:DUF4293 family protein n=1 Tax=Mucilaginibacter celer TaxID=2305508 RepID=A0A494VIE9_9SPHI|nr:hypothetical protein [Mucilaginibacter celer]AYL93924.1 hypothetical protein HYN43_000825 [Mucilaginibacter celer]
MTNQYRGLSIAILIFNCLILIGAGHGVGPIIIFEVMLPFTKKENISFNPLGSYDDSIAVATLIMFIGQLLLFIATHKENIIMRLISLLVMWMGLLFLTHDVFNGDGLSKFTLASATPFLILSAALFSFDVRQYLQKDQTDSELE